MWDEDDTQPPIRVGEGVPGAEPVDLPDRYDHCGHCGTGLVGLPNPEQWVPGVLGDGESVKIWAVQRCFNCDVPSIGTWLAVPGDGGVAKLTDYRLSPLSPAPDLGIPEYVGTAIETYHREAWGCRRAGLRRAAIVMARSTTQACYRRYLARENWSNNYTVEMKAVTALAGSGWGAVASGVRDFGNDWAHPDGTKPPSWNDVAESFRRMEAILKFAAEMERVSHLVPIFPAAESPAAPDT